MRRLCASCGLNTKADCFKCLQNVLEMCLRDGNCTTRQRLIQWEARMQAQRHSGVPCLSEKHRRTGFAVTVNTQLPAGCCCAAFTHQHACSSKLKHGPRWSHRPPVLLLAGWHECDVRRLLHRNRRPHLPALPRQRSPPTAAAPLPSWPACRLSGSSSCGVTDWLSKTSSSWADEGLRRGWLCKYGSGGAHPRCGVAATRPGLSLCPSVCPRKTGQSAARVRLVCSPCPGLYVRTCCPRAVCLGLQVARLYCHGKFAANMKLLVQQLEEVTGGIAVHRAGGTVLLYRGDDWQPPQRPQRKQPPPPPPQQDLQADS